MGSAMSFGVDLCHLAPYTANSMDTTLDRFGRVLIPKDIRDDAGLLPGSVLSVEPVEEGILLRPLEAEPHLRLKNGILVYTGETEGDASDAVRRNRLQRISAVARRARGRKREDAVRHVRPRRRPGR